MSRVLVPFRDEKKVQPYLEALRLTGLDPVAMSVARPTGFEGAFGLLLMGGTDVDPSLYGESAVPETEDPDRERDQVEWELLSRALEADMPVLAICRGLQLLNVHAGGTLIQHLASPKHDPELEDRSAPAHTVSIEPDSRLARAVGLTKLPVNSRHHQAVSRVGQQLRVVARDSDGDVIEGLERLDRSFTLAVQWHPEDQAKNHREHMQLFRSFADAVQKR
jgi:putative glutamine amidotransferase